MFGIKKLTADVWDALSKQSSRIYDNEKAIGRQDSRVETLTRRVDDLERLLNCTFIESSVSLEVKKAVAQNYHFDPCGDRTRDDNAKEMINLQRLVDRGLVSLVKPKAKKEK